MADVGLAPPDSRPELSRFSLAALASFYRERFAMSVAANVAYRGAVAIWIFVTLIQPLVFIVVWRTVAGEGETGGYTANQFVAYFLVMMVVDHMTFIWHMWEFEWRIRTGAFSPLLMRPIHPIHGDVCENLAYKVLGLFGVLPAAVLIGVAFDADLSGVEVGTVLPFLPALVLAMVLRFAVEWCLALAAFWLTKVTAINSLDGRAQADEELVELLERLGHPVQAPGALVGSFLRGIEVADDQQRLAALLLERHRGDGSALTTFVIGPDDARVRGHFDVPTEELHLR
jgi:ABC-2 type transport system permease protein